jgi:hypothetical protein
LSFPPRINYGVNFCGNPGSGQFGHHNKIMKIG